MEILSNVIKTENIELPQIISDTYEIDADYAVGILDSKSSGNGYPYNEFIEHFIKSVVYSCGLLLIVKYNLSINDLFSIIDEAINVFKDDYEKEEDKDKSIIVSVIGNGRREEIEGKIAYVLIDNHGGIVGNRYKYNLAELGKCALSTICSIYYDNGIEQDKIEKTLEKIYRNSLELVRKKFNKENKKNDK